MTEQASKIDIQSVIGQIRNRTDGIAWSEPDRITMVLALIAACANDVVKNGAAPSTTDWRLLTRALDNVEFPA